MNKHLLTRQLEPFQPFLADPDVTDIVVNRPAEIGVRKSAEWSWHDAPSLTYDALEVITLACAFESGQDVDETYPLCATTLPTGERMQVCRPHATARGTISLSIRRPYDRAPTLRESDVLKVDPTSRSMLHDLSGDVGEMLHKAVLAHKNIIACGKVGKRKTTLLMALIDAIPENERIITIEDTPEWGRLKHRNRVALYYSKDGQGVSRHDSVHLMEASLRMIPDRVLLQELRDGAANTYLRSVVAGHPGSLTTLHAETAQGAFDAIGMMVQRDPEGKKLDKKDVDDLLHKHIDVIVHMADNQHGSEFRIDDVYIK